MIYPGLQIIIDHLRKLDNSPTSAMGFDMNTEPAYSSSSEHPCGSACCIGGHAALLLEKQYSPTRHTIAAALSVLCDIPLKENRHGEESGIAYDLCWPGREWYCSYSDITLEQAIQVLEHCRDTGEVDWSIAIGAVSEED